jgi:AcrR family transcriptional regulator
MRQSHLTYYFPTRADLLVAVAERAVDAQLEMTAAFLDGASAAVAASSIAKVVSQAESARVLLMLVSASDDVPEVRELFRKLAAGMVEHGRELLTSLNADRAVEGASILHAISVGLAVIGFATERPEGEAQASQILERTLDMLCKGDSA